MNLEHWLYTSLGITQGMPDMFQLNYLWLILVTSIYPPPTSPSCQITCPKRLAWQDIWKLVKRLMHSYVIKFRGRYCFNTFLRLFVYLFLFNWDFLQPRLNYHYMAWKHNKYFRVQVKTNWSNSILRWIKTFGTKYSRVD